MGFFKNIWNKAKKIGKSIFRTGNKIGKVINQTISNKETITREQISKEEAEALLISRQAYRKPPLNSVGEYILQPNVTNETTVVYKNPNNEIFIGYRGSKVAKDWTSSNISIIAHKESENQRFNDDLAYFDIIMNTIKPNSVKIVGHSLSGLIVMYINSLRNNIKKVYAINPAFNLNAFNKYYKPNVLIIKTLNDVVSSLASFSKYPVKTIQSQYDDDITFMNVLKSHGLGSILD